MADVSRMLGGFFRDSSNNSQQSRWILMTINKLAFIKTGTTNGYRNDLLAFQLIRRYKATADHSVPNPVTTFTQQSIAIENQCSETNKSLLSALPLPCKLELLRLPSSSFNLFHQHQKKRPKKMLASIGRMSNKNFVIQVGSYIPLTLFSQRCHFINLIRPVFFVGCTSFTLSMLYVQAIATSNRAAIKCYQKCLFRVKLATVTFTTLVRLLIETDWQIDRHRQTCRQQKKVLLIKACCWLERSYNLRSFSRITFLCTVCHRGPNDVPNWSNNDRELYKRQEFRRVSGHPKHRKNLYY